MKSVPERQQSSVAEHLGSLYSKSGVIRCESVEASALIVVLHEDGGPGVSPTNQVLLFSEGFLETPGEREVQLDAS